jgi:hypothetical protein
MFLNDNPYITHSLCLSTIHITENDNNILTKNEDNIPIVVYSYKYGFLIHVPAITEGLIEYGFSEELIRIIKKAIKLGCTYVHLDSIGIEYEDLPKFKW